MDLQFNSSVASSSDVVGLCPTINQGIQAGMRIGERVTLKSLKFTGYCKLNRTLDNPDACRVLVRIIIGYPRKFPLQAEAASAVSSWSNDIVGWGHSNAPLDGSLLSTLAPIDPAVFRVLYQKKFWLYQDYTWAPGVNPAPFSQDLSKTIRTLKINLKVKGKVLKFIGSGTHSTNFNPCLLVCYSKADGTPDVLDTRVQVVGNWQVRFSDM